MCSELANDGWDFSPVIDLIKALSSGSENHPQTDILLESFCEDPPTLTNRLEEDSGLGNFDKLWRYLKESTQFCSPESQQLSEIELSADQGYGLDAVAISKAVKWRDEIQGAELTDNNEINSDTNIPAISKSRRRHERRRNAIRRKREDENAQAGRYSKAVSSGSENETEPEEPSLKRLPDRRAIIQQILYGTSSRLGVPDTAPANLEKSTRISKDRKPRLVTSPRPLRGSLAAVFSPESDAYATAAEKKAQLMAKLHSRFKEENLNQVGITPTFIGVDSSSEQGIHVFIDASNIMIGFHDALKLSRGITTRIRFQHLSFHNLSIILERGRSTAKRVLVGSDKFPTIQEAKTIGYETNILERVHKAKELSPRNKRYNSTRNNNSTPGQSSGSETTATMYAPEKWVEQAVDEILHLKILESVVDARTPATIVLATGDAAEAEYSQGFLKMVERALEKGWKVELVSFKHNTSRAYRRKDFRARWGQNFKIVELDEFVEELLGTW